MHRSTTETKRLAACLLLSALLHLTVVLLSPPTPEPIRQVVFQRPMRMLETRAFDPTRPALHERPMQRLAVEAEPAQREIALSPPKKDTR